MVDDESFVLSTQQASVLVFIILKIVGFIKRPWHELKVQQKIYLSRHEFKSNLMKSSNQESYVMMNDVPFFQAVNDHKKEVFIIKMYR